MLSFGGLKTDFIFFVVRSVFGCLIKQIEIRRVQSKNAQSIKNLMAKFEIIKQCQI